jgi:hypothetical protein
MSELEVRAFRSQKNGSISVYITCGKVTAYVNMEKGFDNEDFDSVVDNYSDAVTKGLQELINQSKREVAAHRALMRRLAR